MKTKIMAGLAAALLIAVSFTLGARDTTNQLVECVALNSDASMPVASAPGDSCHFLWASKRGQSSWRCVENSLHLEGYSDPNLFCVRWERSHG